MDNWISKVMTFYKLQIKYLKWGKSIVVDCPVCGNKMLISKSDYNGHLHISCDNCDQFIIQ